MKVFSVYPLFCVIVLFGFWRIGKCGGILEEGKKDVDDVERECEGCLDVVLDFPRGVGIVFFFLELGRCKIMWQVRDLLKKIHCNYYIYAVQWWWLLFANKSFSTFLNQTKRSYESGNYSDGVWVLYLLGRMETATCSVPIFSF